MLGNKTWKKYVGPSPKFYFKLYIFKLINSSEHNFFMSDTEVLKKT